MSKKYKTEDDVVKDIRSGEIDYNNQSHFFAILIKGLLWKLRQDIKIRGEIVPHYILHTGDEIMFLENKGQDYSKDPLEVTNEDYIYTIVPRCAVTPKGITLQPDQLTSPYSNGRSQYEDDERVISFTSEFRRMPLKMSFDLQYVLSSYTDVLELMQQIVTKLSFVQTYPITYMGQTIMCSYNIQESLEGETTLDFDETTTDDRRRKLNLSVDVETNLPIFDEKTIIPTSKYIQHAKLYINDQVDLLHETAEEVIRKLYITSNGTYSTQGCPEIDVDVPYKPEETKSVTYTKNGNYRIAPEEGKVMTGVDVKVSVLPTTEEKTLTVTENGNYTVLPTEADALSKVEVEVDTTTSVINKFLLNGGKFAYSTFKEFPYSGEVFKGVTNLSSMFRCTNLPELDCSAFDTEGATDLSYFFSYSQKLAKLNVEGLVTKSVTNLNSIFNLYIPVEELDLNSWDVSNVKDLTYAFAYNNTIKRIHFETWDTSNVTKVQQTFSAMSKLEWIDVSSWYLGNAGSTEYLFNGGSALKTVIGDHTLAEVEAGEIVAFKDLGKQTANGRVVDVNDSPLLRYASILALANGMYNRTGLSKGLLKVNTAAFSNCRNDDDTIPDADTIAERQAKIRAICAEKNYTLSLS